MAKDWSSWIRSDLRRALAKRFPEHEDAIDALAEENPDEKFQVLYSTLKERTNSYWYAESAIGGHVDIDRLAAGAVASDFEADGV